MQIEGTQPALKDPLNSSRRMMDEAIADYMEHSDHDPLTLEIARHVFEENAEFFEMLGDR
jgi:hypothetical protein